ncbi:MAG: antibiotic biosynthesis monooxygenase family protein [Pseudomonadota bacterium]
MIQPTLKTAALAAAFALGLTSAQAEDMPVAEVAVFLTIKTQPGQRQALVALWDEHLKVRATENSDHVSYVFALDMSDPDTAYITEVYATQSAFEANAQSPWFADYLAKASQLLAGEPGFAMGSPHWVK